MATHRSSGGHRLFGALVVATALSASLVVVGLAAVLPRPAFPLRISSVSVSPNPPVPGDQVVITAKISGTAPDLRVSLAYSAMFAAGRAGAGAMSPDGRGGYTMRIGPFPTGTEVSFVVAASGADSGPVLSDHAVLQVGYVPRGGPSGLRIGPVIQSPDRPRASDSIAVRTEFTSTANLRGAMISSFVFGRGYEAVQPYIMDWSDGYNYTGTIFGTSLPPNRSPLVLIYRITVQDVTWNTAVSEVFHVDLT